MAANGTVEYVKDDDKKSRKAKLAAIDLAKEELDLRRQQLDVDDLHIKAAEAAARRSRQCVYSFTGHVGTEQDYLAISAMSGKHLSSVERCRETLAQWHILYPGEPFRIEFNSPGGDVYEGWALYDFIREMSSKGHHITTVALGVAASMAAVLVQSGDTRLIGRQSKLMLHGVSAGAIGSAFEIEDEAAHFKSLNRQLCEVLSERAKKALGKKAPGTTEFLKLIDRRDCWLTATDALKLGLADKVIG